MTWDNLIFTLPVNFRPEYSTICGIMFNAGRTRAVLVRTNGDVFLDGGGLLPEGLTAKTVACVAAGHIIGPTRELDEFMRAIEMPPVPVEPAPSGSWLIYMKYTQNPIRLCVSEEDAIKWMDKSSLLGLVFWPHGTSWFMIKERITNGLGR